MTARGLVEGLYPEARIRELAAGANKIFRVTERDESAIVKVYPVASRQKRELHALEALAGIKGIPMVANHGLAGDQAWVLMTDGGNWTLSSLPKNLEIVEAAGQTLRNVHDAPKEHMTNLIAGIDGEYVKSHYRSTIERLGRFRRRFGMQQAVLDRAIQIEPPLATDPVPAHTRPTPSKFVVSDDGHVTLVDWEWGTLGPPEWDLTLAVWQFAVTHGEDAAAAFRKGYNAELPESRYRSWVAYHSAMMMLEAAEQREGRLGDLSYLVDDLSEAVMG